MSQILILLGVALIFIGLYYEDYKADQKTEALTHLQIYLSSKGLLEEAEDVCRIKFIVKNKGETKNDNSERNNRKNTGDSQ